MSSLTQKVDDIFAPWDKTVSPGGSLAVIQNGEIVYKRGYGMANLEYGIPNKPSTIFHIASISKHFAAMAVVLLAQEGKLSLDDEVRKHVPEVGGIKEKFTVKQLIHHTSGIRDQWDLLVIAGWRMDDVITTGDVMDVLSRQKELNFTPGSEWLYSNSGFTLLAVIVQNLTGKTLRQFCEERLFKPLGMRSTHFHDDHTFIVPGRAYSYSPAGENLFKNAVLSYATVGATSLFTTVEDLALWDQEFYEGKVVGMPVIEQMHEEGILNDGKKTRYALGLMVDTYNGLKTVEHSGGDAGFRSHLVRFPEQHFSVALLCNLGSMSPRDLALKVADLYLADAYKKTGHKPTRVEKPVKLEEEQLAPLTGLYLHPKTKSTFLVELKEGQLVTSGMPLEALSPERFRVIPYPSIKIEFKKDPAGKETLLLFMGMKDPDVLQRAEQVKPEPAQLKEFAGLYYCPEVDNFWKVEFKEDKLFLVRRKYGSHPLTPTLNDAFSDAEEQMDLCFERKDGKVNAFRLTVDRVRNLKFDKKK
jgi:CubicO group peptidase (beta-lactamase class C family)